jgi:hypothetical protein
VRPEIPIILNAFGSDKQSYGPKNLIHEVFGDAAMPRSGFTVFTLGEELNETVHVLLPAGTFAGSVELPFPTLNNGLGHPALDSEFLVEDEGGVTIAVRLPDLSGEPGTFILGDRSFKLSEGRCFVLRSDWQADQLPAHTIDDAFEYLEENGRT